MAAFGPGPARDVEDSALAIRFARDWKAAHASGRQTPPDPADYLPADPAIRASAALALLRADLTLRAEMGETGRVERYLKRFPDLDGDALVALVYEEFCLREEAGEGPDPAEYAARFPEAADQIRDVLDIHEFVDSARGHAHREFTDSGLSPFPAVGETIAGFRLVGELGRGAIARVFLAEERQLADRRVALKVSRAGSREPQTLAQLQHTHIVPVHSYRIDPASGLHLLCMPYFGRLTLADVLADPRFRLAESGADLLRAVDARRPPGEAATPRAEARLALGSRGFARAIAWWGARLAEALQHAHDRGVLHRDVKPSNVLVTADATPMLLDFNLARPSAPDALDDGRDSMGGTLAYMAPEHLAAATGVSSASDPIEVDARADVYSLGMVLFEALAPADLGPIPGGSVGGVEGLRALIALRRDQAPTLLPGEGRRAIPPALQAVVRRCLAPDPADRYATAADLAADLQAVADDAALRHAREPQPARMLGWVRRRKRPLAAAALLFVTLAAGTQAWVAAREGAARRETRARRDHADGLKSAAEGRYETAALQFASAAEHASSAGRPLRDLAADATRELAVARRATRIRDRADRFFQRAEPLRFRFVTGKGLARASADLETALAEFHVLGNALWTLDPALEGLDPSRLERLRDEVDELLFLWVVASDRPGDPSAARRAVAVCDHALAFADHPGPWRALRDRYAPESSTIESPRPDPRSETSARSGFCWGLLAVLDGRPDRAIAYLEQAVALRPDRFWYQFALAYHHGLFGEDERALAHYDAAVALQPRSSWARFNRGQLLWSRFGAWERALADLNAARNASDGLDESLLNLERGRVERRLGNLPAAQAAFQAVLNSDPSGEPGRRARLGLAGVEAELGPAGRRSARKLYDLLLEADPGDPEARLARASLSFKETRPGDAEADLSRLVASRDQDHGRRASWLADRALARLALGRPAEAFRDADAAAKLDPTPARLRIRARLALANGHDLDPGLTSLDPAELAALPARASLPSDILAAIVRLRPAAEAAEQARSLSARLARSSFLSALGRGDEAADEAEKALAIAGGSAEAHLVSARVLQRAGDVPKALTEVRIARQLAPGDPRPVVLEGMLLQASGRSSEALAVLSRSSVAGNGPEANAARAETLQSLGNAEDAATAWTRVLLDDRDDPSAYLGRALNLTRLERWDAALADLEAAIAASTDRPETLTRIALAYARCLTARPDRLGRVITISARALRVWTDLGN